MKYVRYSLSAIMVSVLFVKCGSEIEKEQIEQEITPENELVVPAENTEHQLPAFAVEVIEVNENQFGYNILMNGQPYIHQPHMPAVGGNDGFSSKEKAEIAGNYIIHKLENNIMPPTVSVNELDSLGVLD